MFGTPNTFQMPKIIYGDLCVKIPNQVRPNENYFLPFFPISSSKTAFLEI